MCCGLGNVLCCPQTGKAAEKTPAKPCDVEVYEKKIKLLEKQRKDVSLFFFLPVLFMLLCHRGKSQHCFSFFFFFNFVTLITGTGGE